MNVLSDDELLDIYSRRYSWDTETFQEFVDTFGVYSRDSVEYAMAEYRRRSKDDYSWWLQDLRVILYNYVEELINNETVCERDKLAHDRDWYELQAKIMEGKQSNEPHVKQYRKTAQTLRKKLKELED